MSRTTLNTCRKNTCDTAHTRTWRRPAYDVNENTDVFSVRVNLPGVSREGVDLSIEGDTLRITGTRTANKLEGWRSLHRELPAGDYRLELRLNVAVNEAKITAKVENGVLELTLPKADEAKPRKIEVSS